MADQSGLSQLPLKRNSLSVGAKHESILGKYSLSESHVEGTLISLEMLIMGSILVPHHTGSTGRGGAVTPHRKYRPRWGSSQSSPQLCEQSA